MALDNNILLLLLLHIIYFLIIMETKPYSLIALFLKNVLCPSHHITFWEIILDRDPKLNCNAHLKLKFYIEDSPNTYT